MDIVSYALLGAAVVADKDLLVPALLFGAGPDLLNGIPTNLTFIRQLRKEGRDWKNILSALITPEQWKAAPSWIHISYLYSHSLCFAGLFTLIIYLLYPSWLPLMKAWFLHIGIDYLTHKDRFAAKPFYPFYDWEVGFFNWFETPMKYLALPVSLFIFGLVYYF